MVRKYFIAEGSWRYVDCWEDLQYAERTTFLY